MKRLLKYIVALAAMMVVPTLLYFGLKVFMAPSNPGQPITPEIQNKEEQKPATKNYRTIPLTVVTAKGKRIDLQVETATTPDARRYGLMFRTSLPEYSGMLFVYTQDQPQSFWMKNTLIPLDAIFINSKKEIVSIKTMTPCKTEVCPAYPSDAPAQYIIEVNGGFAARNGINAGDTVSF
jgi:hypothetical protein